MEKIIIVNESEPQEWLLSKLDKMLQALAEEMPEVEMPQDAYERSWAVIKKNLEGAV